MTRTLARGLAPALALLLVAAPRAATPNPDAPMMVASPEGIARLEAGRTALYNFRLDEARRHFRALGTLEPASPAAAYQLATVAFWTALTREDPGAYDRFYALNDSLRTVLAGVPASPWRTHMEGEMHLQRAAVLARQERYARAGTAFRDACAQFRSNTRGTQPFAESLVGLGACQVAAASIPRRYRWVARLFGFTGTVPQGMASLERAAETATFNRAEAAIGLAFVDAALNDRRGGKHAYAVRVAEAYPESPLVGMIFGSMLLTAREAERAEAVLARALAQTRRPGVDALPYLEAQLGIARMRLGRYAEAAAHFETYTRTYRGQAMVAQTTLLAGLARELSGDRRAAEAHYRRVRSNRDYDADRSAVREAARRLDHPMTPTERALLVGTHAFDAGRYDEAVRTFQGVLGNAQATADERAEAAFRTGRAYQALANYPEAVRHYELAIGLPADPQARWGPWSRYHIGEVRELEGDLAEARRIYRQVLANEADFDYAQALEQRARASLDRL